MTRTLEQAIAQTTGAAAVTRELRLQQLWSGYGEIVRYRLSGANISSVVVKHIALPEELAHPRGWHTNIGHQRKLKSYAVEAQWYRNYAKQCSAQCRVPQCIDVLGEGVGSSIILQDLDAAGYTVRLHQATSHAVQSTIRWLAHFHATWMNKTADGLWPRGSYWHLETRPDEYDAMKDGPLKVNANALDHALGRANYQTVIHGDAKIANFCYTQDHADLVAVDFQYVGRGAGVVDLAYFLGSCLASEELEQQAEGWLNFYFRQLAQALVEHQGWPSQDVVSIETEWRWLYPIAWADFERFLQGWSPGHAKLNSYSAKQRELGVLAVSA